ncbi:hypothetical protein X943_002912 [Babesia divergens]|uniref:Uncharacterized protein n=1 Tax=Babesia divergens TaxID=32595 RepID=A0AAD9G921_BABDI|nr:hypothetical protein X943_002912 [Babesia divergens]
MRLSLADTARVAALLALAVAGIRWQTPCAHAISRTNNTSTLGSTAAAPKESDVLQVEDAEINEADAVHSLDDEIRNHEILDLGRTDDFYLANHGSKCDVLMDDLIDVALEPRDMLKTQQFVGSITPTELRLYFKEHAKGTAKGYKMGKLFARFSFGAIVTPLETIRSSRDCFRMFYKREPIIFCADNTNHRDFWMHAILKAKFCHTAHTVLSKSATPEKGSGPAELPDLSNKAQRLADLLHPKSVSGEAAVGAHHENKITNIDIKNIGMGNPEIYLDGEEIKPETHVKDQEEVLREQAEGAEHDAL